MHKLVVLYPEPADPDHFRDYYVSNDAGTDAVLRGFRGRVR